MATRGGIGLSTSVGRGAGNDSVRHEEQQDTMGAKTRAVPRELAVFEVLPELVVAVDGELVVHYLNPFTRRLVGRGDEMIGTNMVEYIHPDDVERAAEVAGLILEGTLGAEVTPAVYRLHRGDGSWIPVEVTATPPVRTVEGEDRIIILGHYSGDTDLRNRIFTMLTEGRPSDEIIELLPGFGTWRYPEAHYAIAYPTPDGWRRVGSAIAIRLLERFDGPDTPWARARVEGEAQHGWSDLPDDLRDAAAEHGLHGCMVVPVAHSTTEAAVTVAWSTDPTQSVNAHRYALEQMVNALDVVLQWRGHLTELERAARFDALSGLANRASFVASFEDALDAAARSDESVAVLYVDLDDFKTINDAFGHAMGDAVIVAAADRMRALARRNELVGRIGGDEFAVLCAGVHDEAEVTALADRIVAALAEPIEHEGEQVVAGASVGVTVAGPGAVDPEALLATADRALYQAKADGRGRWRRA